MTRRLYGFLAIPALLLVLAFVTAVGADEPVVRDLSDPMFSARDRATILSETSTIEQILREGYPIPSYRLIARGWLDRDFVLYTAGRIEAAGYAVTVVEGEDVAGGNPMWILAAIPLEGKTAWIPVEAGPPEAGYSSRIGSIPWTGNPGSPFSPMYAQFDRIVQLAPNGKPTVSFVAVGQVVVDERTALHASARDPDGTIIAFLWYVNDELVSVETTAIYSHVFGGTGEPTVTLVVIDNRGAEATASRTFEVLAEGGCGCH